MTLVTLIPRLRLGTQAARLHRAREKAPAPVERARQSLGTRK